MTFFITEFSLASYYFPQRKLKYLPQHPTVTYIQPIFFP